MNKKVTIQEAIKANEHSRVRDLGSVEWYDIGQIKKQSLYFREDIILDDWEIEEKPLELWVNEHKDANYYFGYNSKEDADKSADGDRIRCVKMREVTDE